MSLYDWTYLQIKDKPELLDEFYGLFAYDVLARNGNVWASEFAQIYPCYGSMDQHYRYFNKGMLHCWDAMNWAEGKLTSLYDYIRNQYQKEIGKQPHGLWAYEKGVEIMYEMIRNHSNLPEELWYLKHLPKKYEHLKGITEFLRKGLKE